MCHAVYIWYHTFSIHTGARNRIKYEHFQNQTMSLNCSCQWAYFSSTRWYTSMESHGGIILRGINRRTRRKTWISATLSITNPTWTYGCLHGARQTTNDLSHGTAKTRAYRDNDRIFEPYCELAWQRADSIGAAPILPLIFLWIKILNSKAHIHSVWVCVCLCVCTILHHILHSFSKIPQ
jgi:hypothetical protein